MLRFRINKNIRLRGLILKKKEGKGKEKEMKDLLISAIKHGMSVKVILQGGYIAVGIISKIDGDMIRVNLLKADGSMRQKNGWYRIDAIIGVEEI